MFTSWQVNVPQLYADIDRTKARQLGVPVTDVFDTMQIYLGSCTSTTSTSSAARTACACRPTRLTAPVPKTSALLKVRSTSGEMVPLSALMKVNSSFGPERAMRYNGYLTADINGGPAPGYSSGQAQDAIKRIAAETLPQGHQLRVDRADLPGDPGRQLRLPGCSRWRSCWCSWCWPRSTRA
jgi:multidrug efflux pump